MDIEEDEQVGRAVAAILAVVALELARRGRDGLSDLADQLGRALIEAYHRPLGIGRLGIEIKHVLHAGDIGAIDLGDAPHVLPPRLQIVLRQAAAHRLARQLAMLGQLDHRAGQQLQRPACPAGRWLGAGSRHQQGLLLAAQLACPARPRLLAQRSLQVAQHEAALGAVHRRVADAHRPGDLLVAGSGIGRQQDLRSLQLARRMFAAAQQRLKLGAFRFAQLDPVPYIHSDLLEGEPRRIER